MPTMHHFPLTFSALLLLFLAGCSSVTPTLNVEPNANGQRILYVTDETLPPSDLAPRIRTLFDPTEVQGWAFTADIAPNAALDTLIIDGTIPFERIPVEWLSQAYDNELYIVVLDRYTLEVAEMLGDPSISADNWVTGDDPYPGHFYVAVVRYVDDRCSPRDATAVVHNLETDTQNAQVQGLCGGGGGRATYSLEDPLGFEALRHQINRR